MSGLSISDAFELFKKGNTVSRSDVGMIVRSQGLCPTQRELDNAIRAAGISGIDVAANVLSAADFMTEQQLATGSRAIDIKSTQRKLPAQGGYFKEVVFFVGGAGLV
eukprot:m.185780 g.185780  ORF g.185780 m.185780 type:complete len:107 (-) comp16688_c3_seq2:19-339(-)